MDRRSESPRLSSVLQERTPLPTDLIETICDLSRLQWERWLLLGRPSARMIQLGRSHGDFEVTADLPLGTMLALFDRRGQTHYFRTGEPYQRGEFIPGPEAGCAISLVRVNSRGEWVNQRGEVSLHPLIANIRLESIDYDTLFLPGSHETQSHIDPYPVLRPPFGSEKPLKKVKDHR